MKKALTKNEKFDSKEFLIDVLATVLGTFIFAFGVHVFTVPNKIAPGGVTGLATILNYLTSIPIGGITVVLNIPIVILGFIYLGKSFMFKTFVSLITFTISIDFILAKFPHYTGNVMVAAIFGGILLGAGIGLVMKRASSTGGTDIVNRIIGKKIPHIKLGTITFCTDLIVIIISAIAYKSVEPALYSVIALYISARAIDQVVYGFDICKFVYIISDKSDEISDYINNELKRSATIVESYGAYSKEKKHTIMCAVKNNQYVKLKRAINIIDSKAFVVITSATEVVGVGFKSKDL